MYLINGIWQETLPAGDRAIQFGDGCFTTARIHNGRVTLLVRHLSRLRQACQRLAISFNKWRLLANEMQALATLNAEGVLKVILTRGAGGRGYSTVDCQCPMRILGISTLPAFYQTWQTHGVSLTLSPVRLGINPHIAGIKHLNRLEQVLIRTYLEQTPAQEALVLDSDGMLTECCAANLFWRKGQQVFTPFVDRAGVNGVMRRHIIACLQASRWSITQVRAPLSTLGDAEEVIICNALMPVAPVNKAESWYYTSRELYQFLAPLCE